MSDLSWLNPTPHAIAVYASQPLSPAATQHSLPSGRYSLLGPDFHRLDRTSLRLAHSLDHLVDAANQRQRDGEAERLGGLHVDDEFDFGRLLDRQLGGLLAFENSACIDAERAVRIQNGAAVSHEAASAYKLAKLVDRGHTVAD